MGTRSGGLKPTCQASLVTPWDDHFHTNFLPSHKFKFTLTFILSYRLTCFYICFYLCYS